VGVSAAQRLSKPKEDHLTAADPHNAANLNFAIR
jgi:hypothetical protein